MSFNVKAFVTSPTIEVLEQLKKVQLLAVIRELQIEDVKVSMTKSELKTIIVEHFVEEELLDERDLDRYSGKDSLDLELKKLEMEMQMKLKQMEIQEKEKRKRKRIKTNGN